MVTSKTYVLKLTNTCNCEGCNKEIKKLLRNINGVEKHSPISEEGKVSVTGTMDPHKLVQILGDGGKKAQLDQQYYYQSKNKTNNMNHQERQIVPVESARIIYDNPQMDRQASRPSKAIVVAHAVGKSSTTTTANTSRRHPPAPHEHEFELKNNGKWFDCNGCKERGFGSTYRCKGCEHDRHKECYLARPTISHDFLGGQRYTLQFLEKPKPGRTCYCSACGKEIHGFVYYSKEGGELYLHPCCSSLEKEKSIDGVSFELRKNVPSSKHCLWCKKKKLPGSSAGVPGWCYVSSRESFRIHVYCLTEMVREALKRGAIDNVHDAGALEKMDMGGVLVSDTGRRGGGGGSSSVFWKTVKIFLRAIVSILLGDPTTLVASVLVELLAR